MDVDKLKYPIGQVDKNAYTFDDIQKHIDIIASFPELLTKETAHLNTPDLSLRYRPGGWTINQVIHHCLDSHMNAVIRFKLALTEDNPVIKPYEEQLWAGLDDTINYKVSNSLNHLKLLHNRWSHLLNSLDNNQWNRTFQHPSEDTVTTLFQNVGIYAWHCRHHLAHVKQAKELRFL